jgi:hypothetical protein
MGFSLCTRSVLILNDWAIPAFVTLATSSDGRRRVGSIVNDWKLALLRSFGGWGGEDRQVWGGCFLGLIQSESLWSVRHDFGDWFWGGRVQNSRNLGTDTLTAV